MTLLDRPVATVLATEITSEGELTILVTAPGGDPLATARSLSAAISPARLHLAQCRLEDGTEVYPIPSTSLGQRVAPGDGPVRLVLRLRRRHAGHRLDGLVRADAVHRVETALQLMPS